MALSLTANTVLAETVTDLGRRPPSKNASSDYGPQGKPVKVDTHDFENKQPGKVVPYGVYNVVANKGYVSLGIDHDTAQFAVHALRLWLAKIGRERYPTAR